MKKLSKIIREFDKLIHKSYERSRPKHDPTGSYFYLSRNLASCMMRADSLTSHVYPVIMENDWYKIDFNIARLFNRQERIRRVPS